MTNERSRYGLLVSSLGAALLAGSVFLPWYGVSVTQAGVGSLSHIGGTLASHLSGVHRAARHDRRARGQQVGALTAEQALQRSDRDPARARRPLAARRAASRSPLGARRPGGAGRRGRCCSASSRARCVLYRMIAPPAPAGDLVVAVAARGRVAGAARLADDRARRHCGRRRCPAIVPARGLRRRHLGEPDRLDPDASGG